MGAGGGVGMELRVVGGRVWRWEGGKGGRGGGGRVVKVGGAEVGGCEMVGLEGIGVGEEGLMG